MPTINQLVRKGRKKIEGEVSVLIFRSGSIIITGYKKPIEAKYAFEYINQILSRSRYEEKSKR